MAANAVQSAQFTKKGIEKLTEKLATKRTSAKLAHYFESDGSEAGSKDPITQNLIGVIEELRIEFNKLYDEVELIKAYITDVFGLTADNALDNLSAASSLSNVRFENGSLYFTVDTVEYEVKLIRIVESV